MVMTRTARYLKVPTGDTGQIKEWPEVVTEGKEMPTGHAFFEPVTVKSV